MQGSEQSGVDLKWPLTNLGLFPALARPAREKGVHENRLCPSFSRYTISFLTDDIIRLRYVEIDGQLRKVMVVIKMRGGNHSKDIREYVITGKGMVVIHPRSTDYDGLTTGIPERTGPRLAQKEEAAPEPKATK